MITQQRIKQNLRSFIPTSIYDISANSDKYFGVYDIPRMLSLGKNLIKLNYNKNTLYPNSTIFVEFIDANGNAIYHEVLDTKTDDGSKIIVVYIYPSTPTGKVTFYLAGKAVYDIRNGQKLSPKSDVNLVWSTDIPITTTKQNNSEVYFSQDPTVQFYERLVPYYVNATGSVGRQIQYSSTSSSLFINSVATSFQQAQDNSIFAPKNDSGKRINIDPDFSAGKGTTKSLVKVPQFGNFQTIYSTNFTFTPEMEGGQISLNNITFSTETPRDAADASLFNVSASYSASIIKVVNENTIQVDKPFYYSIDYQTRAGENKTFTLNKITDHNNATASYYSPGTMSVTAATESFVTFNFKDVEPVAGTVDKIHIKYKPIGSFGEFIDVGEFAVLEQNLLTDSGSLYQTPRNGLVEKEIGFVKSQSDVTSYWSINSSSYGGSVSAIATSSRVTDGLSISHAGINSSAKYIIITPAKNLPAEANTEYKLSFRASVTADLSGSIPNQVDVYISGSSISTDIIKNVVHTDILKSLSYGTYIGSITNEVSTIEPINIFFKVGQRKDIKPIFVIRSGNWTLGQIGIYPRKEIGFSPNHIKLNIPVSLFRRQTDMIINIDYLNEDGIKGNTFTKIYGAYISGSNAVFTGRDNQFTGSFSGSYQGDGRLLTVSWSNMVGTPSGLVSASLDTSSFALKTNITGAFTIASGGFSTRINLLESSSSLFAYKTEISGAFTTVSGGLGARITVVENFTTQSFITSSASGSWVRNPQTGGFSTTGSNTYVGNQIVSGTFDITGSSVRWNNNNLLTSANTSSFVVNSQTSSFALKTDVSGAFTSISSSIANTRLLSDVTSSYVPNSLTGSFALKTDISGAFTIASSSITNRLTVVENIASGSGSFVRNADTASMLNPYLLSSLTSSFALKTDITGAFNTISSSITNRLATTENIVSGTVKNTDTGSMLNPYLLSSSTSSFALKTNISGAFTVASGGLGDRITVTENFITGSFIRPSDTSSMLLPYLLSSNTSSFAIKTDVSGAFNLVSSSFGIRIANVENIVSGSGSYVRNADTSSMLSPYLFSSVTSSYVPNSLTSSFALKTDVSGAFNLTSSSFGTRVTTLENTTLLSSVTSSIVFNSSTSSFANKTEISGAFTVTSSSLGNRITVTENFITGSFIRPSDTGSFAIKTDVSGAFNSISSSITTRTTTLENTTLLSSITSSYVPNSLTSSFAINTNITGAFTSTSSSISTRVTTLENTKLDNSYTSSVNSVSSSLGTRIAVFENHTVVSSSAQLASDISGSFLGITGSMLTPYLLSSITSSYVRNAQTGGFSTTGSNTYVGSQTITGSMYMSGSLYNGGLTFLRTDTTGSKWGIFKVNGETTGSTSGSTGRNASVQSNYGELQIGGTTVVPEDVASIKYIYGLQIDPTASCRFDIVFPVFKNTTTGLAYGTSGSRNAIVAVDVNILVFVSGSALASQPNFVYATTWRSRFMYTSTTVTQSSDASVSSYGSASFNDSWFSTAINMGSPYPQGGITMAAPNLTIPSRFTSTDGRKYGLNISAECKVVKHEFL